MLILGSASPRRAQLLTAAGIRFEVQAADVDETPIKDEAPAAYVQRLAVAKARAVAERYGAPALTEPHLPAPVRPLPHPAAPVRTHPHPSAPHPHPSAPVRTHPHPSAPHPHPSAPHPHSSAPHPHPSAPHPLVLGADTTVVVDEHILAKPADAAEARQMLERLAGRRHEVLTGVALAGPGDPVTAVASTAVWFVPMTSEDIAWYIETGEWQDKAGAYGIQGRISRFVARVEGSYTNVVGLPVSLVCGLLMRYPEGRGAFRSTP